MIEIVKPYSHLPGDLYVNGKYWLDMAVDAVRLSEKIDNFLIDKIDVPAAIGLTFPRTMRNRLALEPFINGQSGQFAGRACKVVAYLGDVTLPFSDLFIISSTEKEYSGELRLGDDYWLIKAELLKLNSILTPLSFCATDVADGLPHLSEYLTHQIIELCGHVSLGYFAYSPLLSGLS